jgi:hypothetical protein
MKKSWMALVAVSALVLAGCNDQTAQQPDGNAGMGEVEQNQTQTAESSGVTEWMAGLLSGKAYECEYAMPAAGEEGGGTATIVMQGERYRTEVETTEGTFISVFDGETSYSWMAGETEGMKMSHTCMEDFGEDMAEFAEEEEMMEETFETPEEALETIPDISCHETSSADFSVPGDVEFVDQCEMLQTQMQMMEQMQDQMPAEAMQMMEGMGQ